MAKLTTSDLASLANETSAIATINNNNALIETALENTLSRDGTSPNTMGAALDMDSHRILNLPEPIAATEPVRLQDMAGTIDVVNSLTPFATTLMDDASASEARTTLGLLPAATTTIGTSGAVLSLLNTANTHSGVNTFSNTTDATSSTAAGTIVSGGLAVAKKINVGTSGTIGTSLAVGTSITAGTNVTIGAGTSSTAPINFTSGSVLATPVDGAVEYDGKIFYLTPSSTARHYVPTEKVIVLSGNYALTDTSSAQKAFDSSSLGTVGVSATTTYLFEGQYLITNTGTNAHTWATLIALTTATLTSGNMVVRGRSGTTSAATLTAESSAYTTDVTTALVSTASSTSSTENVILSIRGVLRVNTGGTITPQVKLSATTGGTITMLANSYFRIWPIGTNAVTTIGNWT